MNPSKLGALICFSILCCPALFSQTSTTGIINVNVVDASGAVVPDATLELQDTSTNDIRRASTQAGGAYSFQGLQFGTYRLNVSKTGFAEAVIENVQVQTSRITDVKATLSLGRTTQSVDVSGASPVVEASASTLSTTIDTKQVVNLPVIGRNVMSLAFLVPGWSTSGVGNNGAGNANGTWNNMPGGAVVSADFDGTPGISNRFRSGGFNYGTTAVQPRLENVGEMTISTAQLDLSGTGTSAMRISIVSRHGTNEFHGRLYEDFRNNYLNANSWSNNARGLPRAIFKLNDFGASVGGPIIKNKLFFFGTWAQSIQPGTTASTSNVLSPAAQQGIFTYRNNAGALQTINLLQLAGNSGVGNARNSVLPSVASQLQTINSSLSSGSLTPTSDPNINLLAFQLPSKITTYYPTVRIDYTATDNVRLNVSYGQTKQTYTGRYAPTYPGGVDPIDYASSGGNNRIAGFGVDWTMRPTLINQFHAGYMYQYSVFVPENLGIDLTKITQQTWNYGTSLYQSNIYPRTAISSFYPMMSANDSLSWQKGDHSIVVGASWYREQDHYWNGPGGFPNETLGISVQDPLAAAFTSVFSNAPTTALTNAQNLYAELTGRLSAANIAVGRPLDPNTLQYKQYGSYNLNEAQTAYGMWLQDRWRVSPSLTLNYGLRWDVVGDNHNIPGNYSAPPSLGDLWGPTPVGGIFQPGTLNGGVANPVFQSQVHAYNGQWRTPSPAFALAWNPQKDDGLLGKVFGNGKTVIRTGYSLRHYTEGAQNFWAYASNSGQFFYQSGSLTSNPTPTLGNFTPGSLTVGDPLPAFLTSPAVYSTTVGASALFGTNNSFWGMNRNIAAPYVQQWNFGIQRELGQNSAFEVRYVGNLSLHQWMGYNINEVNIVENGFLNEFKNAQGNLSRNVAAGRGNTFANLAGVSGDVPLPIMTAAFGGPTSNNFTSGTYITNLNTGAAGTLARTIANNPTFFCNMVGTASFPACASRGVNVPGNGYPVNFFQVNPYANGSAVNYLDASGTSNYHALQVEFRQRPTYGAQFNVNYTWSHSLALAAQNGIQGQGAYIYYTDRNFRLNYGPSLFDIRHVVHVSGTYDLPFGRGKKFMSQNGVLDRVFGGWTIGTIFVMQSGTPFQLNGGFGTLNYNNATNGSGDDGIYMNGITTAQVQSMTGVYKSGNPWVTLVDPSLIARNGAAVSSLTPANVPGVMGTRPYIYGPHWFNDDLSVNKEIPITERIRLSLQGQFINLTNHPTFTVLNGGQSNPQSFSVQSLTFGQTTAGPTNYRQIELRANIVF